MRVLFVTCHLPYPPLSGGRRREHELLARLSSSIDLEVCAVTKTFADDRAALRDVPWRHSGIHLFEAEPWEHPAPQVARHGSAAARHWLRDNAPRFDAIHVEGFYMWQHLPPQRPPAVLGEQNVEYQLWKQRGLLAESRATRSAERAAWREADALAAITYEDRAVMAAATGREVHVVPDGADHDSLFGTEEAAAPSAGPSVVFVGNFAYEPNVDAAAWLASEIFPAVRERTGATLYLVGNAPPPEVAALACDGIEVTGRVPAVEPWLDAATVVACPLRVGGGVKVKVLEALRRGKAVVATPQCLNGLPDGERALRVALAPEDFAGALVDVVSDDGERRRLEAAAARCAGRLPTWDGAAAALADAWQSAALPAERAA